MPLCLCFFFFELAALCTRFDFPAALCIRFDFPLLYHELARHGLPSGPLGSFTFFDTLELYKAMDGNGKKWVSRRLGDLYQRRCLLFHSLTHSRTLSSSLSPQTCALRVDSITRSR